ncbi:hypothetical protein JCM11491_003438 [Sporobolomyces phaffii]
MEGRNSKLQRVRDALSRLLHPRIRRTVDLAATPTSTEHDPAEYRDSYDTSSSRAASSHFVVATHPRLSASDCEEAAIQAAIDRRVLTPASSFELCEPHSRPHPCLEAILEAPSPAPKRPHKHTQLRPTARDPHVGSYFVHEPSSEIMFPPRVVDYAFLRQLDAALQVVAEYPFLHADARPAYGTQHSTPEPGQRDLSGLYRPPTTNVPPPSASNERSERDSEGRVEPYDVEGSQDRKAESASV